MTGATPIARWRRSPVDVETGRFSLKSEKNAMTTIKRTATDAVQLAWSKPKHVDAEMGSSNGNSRRGAMMATM